MLEMGVICHGGGVSFCDNGKETGELDWTSGSGWVREEEEALEPLGCECEENWWEELVAGNVDQAMDSPVHSSVESFLDACKECFGRGIDGGLPTPSDEQLARFGHKLNQLSATDMGVSVDDVPDDSIGFMYAYEGTDFNVMMMLLPEGVVVPNHDHPEMTVYSKVLFGEVEVSSFDPKETCQCEKNCLEIKGFRTMPVSIRRNREHWTPESGALKTLMQEGNLHQFTACKASCVLDVMAPPYDEEDGGKHECSYYRVGPGAKGCLHAVAVPAPDSFFTTRLEFPARKEPRSIREPTIEPEDVREGTRVGAGGGGVVDEVREGGESSAGEDSPRLASSFKGMHVDR